MKHNALPILAGFASIIGILLLLCSSSSLLALCGILRSWHSASLRGMCLTRCLSLCGNDCCLQFFLLLQQNMEHLSWRCNLNNPNNHHPLDTLDAFDMARKYMLDGLQWDYGTGKKDEKGIIKIIDWENPENNTFEFVENWQGAQS